jgi:hypothetical protein
MPKKQEKKIRTQEEIDKLRGTAKDYAQRTRGESVDRELEALLPVLREQGKQFPDLEHGERRTPTGTISFTVNDWFEAGQLMIRIEGWGKTPRDFATEDDIDDEMKLPFEERLYDPMFVDALADEFASRAKLFRLTPPLVQFTIRVLQAALDHGRKLPPGGEDQRKGLFFRKEELAQYLAELKTTGESYRESPAPPKLKGRPGPKPKLKILEHAGPAAYVTNADPDFSKKIADMDQGAT